jgi:hypothetical protein
MIAGIKCEFQKVFGGNESNWRFFNFTREDGDDDSLLSRLAIVKETQWNHTSTISGFIRLVIVFIVWIIFLLPNYLISSGSHIIVVALFKITIPLLLNTFFAFYILKLLLKRINLANETIFTLSSEIL